MVQIGEIYVGGKEGHPQTGIIYNSGVAFSLNVKSPINHHFEYESGNWEVEISKNNQNIIARCKDFLAEDDILAKGFDYCQKFLDMLSILQNTTLLIQKPNLDFFLLFNNNGQTIGRITSNGNLKIEVEATIQILDKEGKEKPTPPESIPDWLPTLRYFRFSQSESDLYDAYRYLYLSFESLLQDIIPITPGEREVDWMNRALTEIGKQVRLVNFVPNGVDPIQYIIGVYYEHFRCKIFHAKNRNYILPHESIDTKKLTDAFIGLSVLWREIAKTFKNIPMKGGVITYQGFMFFMDPVGTQGFEHQFTEDPSPVDLSLTQINPLGHPVYVSTNNTYIRDYKPGIVLFKGEIENIEQLGLGLIHRIGLKSGKTLYTVSFFEEGIIPIGIDKLERYETMRLLNKSSPKIFF